MTKSKQFHFLFATLEAGGNVTPLMLVVSRLVGRGHHVRVMSDLASKEEAEKAGAQFIPWMLAPSRPDRSREHELIRDWEAATPEDGMRKVIGELLCGKAHAYAQDVLHALDRQPADLVVSLPLLLGVMAGCESRGQAMALLAPSISPFPISGIPPFGPGLKPAKTDAERILHAQIAIASRELFDTGLPSLNEVRKALGLCPLAHVEDQLNYGRPYLLGTARAFDFPPDVLPERVRYVGPLIRDPAWVEPWSPPWPAADSRPLVLVGFSTSFQNHVPVLQNVIDACAELPVRVLVTLGGSVHPRELTPAPNSVLVGSAPHSAVMADASVLVTHGGHGTIANGLVRGLPMLVIPLGRDQFDNAVRITDRGAGLCLPRTASAGEIREAIKRLLQDPSFSTAARKLGDAVATEIENSTVVEELESAALASLRRLVS